MDKGHGKLEKRNIKVTLNAQSNNFVSKDTLKSDSEFNEDLNFVKSYNETQKQFNLLQLP